MTENNLELTNKEAEYVVEYEGEDDWEPSEYDEWMDFDCDC